jgi:hypothetical protein
LKRIRSFVVFGSLVLDVFVGNKQTIEASHAQHEKIAARFALFDYGKKRRRKKQTNKRLIVDALKSEWIKIFMTINCCYIVITNVSFMDRYLKPATCFRAINSQFVCSTIFVCLE